MAQKKLANLSDEDIMARARSLLSGRDPFFATLAYNLDCMIDRNPPHPGMAPTIGTDGRVLIYNPDYLRDMDNDELLTTMCHEMLHIVFRHPWRRGGRDPKKWNIAGDVVINLMLERMALEANSPIKYRFKKTPGSLDALGLLRAAGINTKQFEDKTTEQVYNMLPDKVQLNQCSGCNRDATGPNGEKLSPQEMQEAEQDAEILTNQAEQAARMQGKLPAGLERILGTMRDSKIDYRNVLPEIVQTAIARDEINWRRPLRRAFGAGLYIPTFHNPTLGRIYIGLDTSGSISGPILEQFFGEIHALFEQFHPEEIIIIDCDAAVHSVKSFKRDDFPITGYKPKGGGGTDFRPVFQHIQQHADPAETSCLVYLTDLYGTFPEEAPDYPVLWVVYGGASEKAPFGITAHIKES